MTFKESDKIYKTALYGAIIGDIVGSRFEGKGKKIKTKDFDFFSPDCRFTDDTVMTIAVADGFLHCLNYFNDFDNISDVFVHSMQYWGRKYPHGYGKRFKEWIFSDNPKPYNSYGNGSAMRISAAGWIYASLSYARLGAEYITKVSHNHHEGINGAMSVASAIFLARNGSSKEDIKKYIEIEFDYNLSRKLDDIRPTYHFDVTCQGSVPESIIAFLESENFEDAVRNAVSLGGDSDTLAAITGSIAEAFYGIPENLIEKCREYLPQDILHVVDVFNAKIFGEEQMYFNLKIPKQTEFIRKPLTNKSMTKKFFENMRFIHTSDLGAMGDAGVIEVWTKNFEHYRCHWSEDFNEEKFFNSFIKDGDISPFHSKVKNSWCFHYMGCGHKFYIKKEFDEIYLKKFEEAQQNGAGYMIDNDVPPVEKIMLEILNEPAKEYKLDNENDVAEMAKHMESAINKFELKDNIIVYRRADISLLSCFEKIALFGGIFQDDGFVSATTLRIGSTANEIEISIMIPKGKGRGAYIAPMSLFPDECEFVINCGTIFKIIHIEYSEEKVIIDIDAIGRNKRSWS